MPDSTTTTPVTSTTTTAPATPDYSALDTALPTDASLADIVSAVNGLKTAVGSVKGLTADQESALAHVVAFFNG